MNGIIKKLSKSQYFQAITVVGLIVLIVLGFYYGSQIALNTNVPWTAVSIGSMNVQNLSGSDFWNNPFSRTLQVGDVVMVQGVSPKDFNTNYPESDIIVFPKPDNPDELIVHRIVATRSIDGKMYFFTKGDGNSAPDTYDPWNSDNDNIPTGAVSQDLVVGKVVMRVPWVGYFAIFSHDVLGVNNSFLAFVLPIIVILIILYIISEFVAPLLNRKPPAVEQKTTAEQT